MLSIQKRKNVLEKCAKEGKSYPVELLCYLIKKAGGIFKSKVKRCVSFRAKVFYLILYFRQEAEGRLLLLIKRI
jgi:hypothetical protein